jgi:hypothetical protein
VGVGGRVGDDCCAFQAAFLSVLAECVCKASARRSLIRRSRILLMNNTARRHLLQCVQWM